MKALLIIAFIAMPIIACYGAYLYGMNKAAHRPIQNHRDAIRALEKILNADDYVPVLPAGMRGFVETLVKEFDNLPTPTRKSIQE